MKRVIFGLLALTLMMGWASPGWAVGLKLTIRDGRVSLDAQDVTIRQILTEWARVGKTRIVNLERVNSGPVTLKFDGVPEDEALDVILRALPGYMAAPRATLVADASIYDRIVIMPTTTAVAAIAIPTSRPQTSIFQDPSANITQLRPATALNPGLLPESDDPRDVNDPAMAAAIAAGLVAVPAPSPGSMGPNGPLQPPVRSAGPFSFPEPNQPQQVPANPTPSNPWNVPLGASRPGPAPAPPPSNPPPGRGVGARPQPADQ